MSVIIVGFILDKAQCEKVVSMVMYIMLLELTLFFIGMSHFVMRFHGS